MFHFQDKVKDNVEDKVMDKVKKWQSDVASRKTLDEKDFELCVSLQTLALLKNI